MKDRDWGDWDIPRRWQPLVTRRKAADEACKYASDGLRYTYPTNYLLLA